MDERSQYVLAVVDNVLEIHAAWSESDDQIVTEVMFNAIEELIQVCSEGTIPGGLRDLFQRVGELAGVWRRYVNSVESTRGDTPPLPGQGVWSAIDAITEARQRAVEVAPPPVESIEDLMKINPPVGDRQIAIMFGWCTKGADGRPEVSSEDMKRVQEEKRKPGLHTGPESNWVHPQLKEQQQQAAAAIASAKRIKKNRDRKIELMTEPPPESIVDLAQQGVSATQIAKMHQTTVDNVMAACDEASTERPVLGYSIETPMEPVEPPLEEPGERVDGAIAVDGGLTMEQEIIAYHQNGESYKTIAGMVTRGDETVSWQKVKSIVDRFKKEPEVFNMPEGV